MVNLIKELFDTGRANAEDFITLEDAALNGEPDIQERVMGIYLKHSKVIKEAKILDIMESTRFSYLLREIILGLSYRRLTSDRYQKLLLNYIKGVNWDKNEDIRISAINAYGRVFHVDEDIKHIVAPLLNNENEIVRESAQELLNSNGQ